ncbi:Flp family type IVb pilin [Chloroflexus sp.]|uniref:Flp family type IVb pilin n=1 Tax=Chloroflexus sp. TaxID=1904827 RepID=UPI00262E3603|nr:Flp family type IVb pilin [uncultured Chloroflexus sp.]
MLMMAIQLAILLITGRQYRERGQGLAEYGLIITLIALVCVAAISAVGGSLSDMFNTVRAIFPN